jgi:hypothetical protein
MNKDKRIAKNANNKLKDIKTKQSLFNLNTTLQTQYKRSQFCQHNITIQGGQTSSKHCKLRWCTQCNLMRMAIRCNHYEVNIPYLTQYTTLTTPNPTAEQLPIVLKKIKKFFRNYTQEYNYKNTLTGTIKGGKHNKHYNPDGFSAILNYECTFNTITKTYHLHVHVLHKKINTWIYAHAEKHYQNFSNKRIYFQAIKEEKISDKLTKIKTVRQYYNEGAKQRIYYQNELTKRWLKEFPNATAINQRVIPLTADDTFNKLEIFKYNSKPFSNFDDKGEIINETKEEKKQRKAIYIEMADHFFQTVQGKRLFQTYNLDAPPLSQKTEDELIAKDSNTIQALDGSYTWNYLLRNWYNKYTEPIQEYTPEEVKQLSQTFKNYCNDGNELQLEDSFEAYNNTLNTNKSINDINKLTDFEKFQINLKINKKRLID